MNGRCETDPLDRAIDVCDSCYGEFCDACLVRPKGRRHPVCTDCAIIASGVSRESQPDPRGSKRTAKKRRAALKAQPNAEEAVFTYFDADRRNDYVALARRLRSTGRTVELYPEPRKLGAQLRYADRRGHRLAVIIWTAEWAEATAQIKILATGDSVTVPLVDLETELAARLVAQP